MRLDRSRSRFALVTMGWLGALLVPGVMRAEDDPDAFYQESLAPVLAKYCHECHGPDKQTAGLNLSSYPDARSVAQDRSTWERVYEYLAAGLMPPEDRPQPDEEAIEEIVFWIEAWLSSADCDLVDPGRVTLRRLNRAEYNNTIRDLIGVDFQPADDFPSDDVGYGFDNIGDVLTLSPLLLEKYLAAAETISEMAIDAEGPTPGPVTRWPTRDLSDEHGGQPFDTGRILASQGEIGVAHAFPRDGSYRIRVLAYGHQAGPDPARMEFRLDGQVLATVDVTATDDAPEVYEIAVDVEAGERRVAVAFINDYYQPDHPDPTLRGDRNLIVETIEVQGPAETEPRPRSETHQRIIFREPTGDDDTLDCARELLQRFASRAYRRPVSEGEVEKLVWFVVLAQDAGESFERGIQLAIQAVLVSPNFLFRVELDPGRRRGRDRDFAEERPSDEPRVINHYELASRLSYFLWSSMPDDELFELADAETLHDEEVLEAQVRRMLADPKAQALVENFASQWLTIRNLENITPDPELFPSFDEDLRAAMLRETELFFQAIMTEDHSILEFLDADFTFVNEALARHYGIEGVEGEHFQRVALAEDSPRGGILTQASILTVTSNPTRTSPVNRGKWILEQILGTPPPPPPPDVPELEEDEGGMLTGSLRQRLEQHRSNPGCATCHSRMDPLGFGFENFDAIGRWRDRDGEFPIDPSGELPSGETFSGPQELKAVLQAKQDEFTRCLTEKLLTFALGRGLEPSDRCAVDDIVESLDEHDYKFSRLVLAIVTSDPFRKRKGHAGEGE